MNVLLDSHALLWAASAESRLSTRARDILASETLWFSVASYWELLLKEQTRKSSRIRETSEVIQQQIMRRAIQWLDVTPAHVRELAALPVLHADPFDRLLIAQARAEGFAVLTADASFRRYDVDVVW